MRLMKSFRPIIEKNIKQKGYVLIVLLLFLALLSISFLAVIQKADFEIKRGREEELIHRGVQYRRAIRKFINEFKRYPTSIEELESTNNIRCLRKRYKDPITGKDFKILHLTDMPGFVSSPPAAPARAAAGQQVNSQQAVNASLASGGPPAAPASVPDSEPNEQTDEAQSDQTTPKPAPPKDSPPPSPTNLGPGAGGLIIGVASTSKDRTIREFDKKDHYNQWLFIYDPSSDRGGLMNTPDQRTLQSAAQAHH
jgi:type II secretory pathway pseudopilin PulG